MATTLKQIADKLQVSKGLVSGVLNSNPAVRVSPKNRERVLAAALDLGYQPNAIARALTIGQSHVFVVWITNPFSSGYIDILKSLHQIAHEDGYQLMVSETANDLSYQSLGTTYWSWPVDGILAVDSSDRAAQHIASGVRVPIVCLGATSASSMDFAVIDLEPAVDEAIDHLITVGRTRIAFLTPDLARYNDARAATYHSALAARGLVPELIVANAWNDREGACEAVSNRFAGSHRPDALFCFSDDLAIGAYRALRSVGLCIPDDVSIVGCGDIEEGLYHAPPLSSINPRSDEMCRAAWNMLRLRTDELDGPPQVLSLPARYVPRESVGHIKEKMI